ncbi:MAG: hypothetical protein H7834_16125 [Magnetococcus sp. YQC-9]
MNSYRLFLLVFCTFCAPFSVLDAAPATKEAVPAASSATTQSVSYRNGKLSVAFRATPIREALHLVADKAGIQFLLDPEVTGKVSVQFDELPLEKGLRRLLNGQSYAVVQSSAKEQNGAGRKGDKTEKSAKEPRRITQVKVFKKGSVTLTNHETIDPAPAEPSVEQKGGAEKGAPQAGGGKGGASARQAGSASKGDETARGRTREVEGGKSPTPERVDVHGVRGPAQLMAAINETEAAIALIHRKAAGERQAIEYESARTRELLASGQGNAKALVDKLTTLEQQKARSEQNTQAMLAPEQQKLQQLRQDMASLKTPADQQIENRAMVNRQAAVMRDQVNQVEEARRAEAARQAAIVAEQRAAAARDAEAGRQAEIKRQQGLAAQSAKP